MSENVPDLVGDRYTEYESGSNKLYFVCNADKRANKSKKHGQILLKDNQKPFCLTEKK